MTVSLCSVEDIEAELGGVTLSDAETEVVSRLITRISAYIDDETPDFGLEVVEDGQVRIQADYRGVISLPRGPIVSVTSVVDDQTGEEVVGWYRQGDEIIAVGSFEQVIVTMTHGDSPAAALVELAKNVVLHWYRDEEAFAPLMSKTVGAETLTYSIGARTEDLGASVLNRYRSRPTTFFLGPQMENSSAPATPWIVNS